MIKGQVLHVKMDSLPCDMPADAQSGLINDTLRKIRPLIRSYSIQTLLVTVGWEHGLDDVWPGSLERFLADVKSTYPSLTVVLMANHWVRDLLGSRFDNNPDVTEVLHLDVYLLRNWYLLSKKHKSRISTSWNPNNTNILFLTGHPFRINRIRLLYKLLKTGLKKNLVYSFRMDPRWEMVCRELLRDITDDEFAALLRQQRAPDNTLVANSVGIPYGQDLYDSALFQIISEVRFDQMYLAVPCISEKTWLSIINSRPFIMSSNFFTLRYLRKRGFHTFEHLLPVPQYDDPDDKDFLHYGVVSHKQGPMISQHQRTSWAEFYDSVKDPNWPQSVPLDEIDKLPQNIRDEIMRQYVIPIEDFRELRLDATIENALYWQHNIKSMASVIAPMAEHNHRLAMELGQQNFQRYSEFCARHGIEFSIDML